MSVLTTKILQIVPRLSPDIDGVGDYALHLARQLRDRHRIFSEFLVFRPSDSTQSQVDGFAVHHLTTYTVEGLLKHVSNDVSAVVLQYSNYPYLMGKLDAPTWLIPSFRALKQQGLRFVTMFHELPTLRYHRIHCPNPMQRRISRGLAQLADIVVTNNAAFQQTLMGWSAKPVHRIPNFSTIGEPKQVLPLSDRDRSLIIFGSTDRGLIYRSNSQGLRRICRQLNIQTLYDIGRPIEWDAESLQLGVNMIKTGILPDSQVSQLMLNAFAGIFDYRRFPHNLAKSTVYAAYCAHGLLPICNQGSLPPQDGIVANNHYLNAAALSTLTEQAPDLSTVLQIIANNARAQYSTHTLARCAEAFSVFIQSASISAEALSLAYE